MQGKRNTFTCRKCHKTKTGNYFISPTLCKKCSSSKRKKYTNAPTSYHSQTNNTEYTITPASLKRLRKRAKKEIKYNIIDIFAVFITITQYFIIFKYIREIYVILGLYLLIAILYLPLMLFFILLMPRYRRVTQHIDYLIEKRKRDYDDRVKFYSSPEWKKIRKQIIKSSDSICSNCGKNITKSSDITIDHIKPRSKYPHLSYDLNNLTILCRECNSRKGNREYI